MLDDRGERFLLALVPVDELEAERRNAPGSAAGGPGAGYR